MRRPRPTAWSCASRTQSEADAPPIDVYWGSAVDFLNELREQLAKSADEPAAPVIADEEDEDEWISF